MSKDNIKNITGSRVPKLQRKLKKTEKQEQKQIQQSGFPLTNFAKEPTLDRSSPTDSLLTVSTGSAPSTTYNSTISHSSNLDSSISSSSSSMTPLEKKKADSDEHTIEIPREEPEIPVSSSFSQVIIGADMEPLINAANHQADTLHQYYQDEEEKRKEEKLVGRTCRQRCRERGAFFSALVFLGSLLGFAITAKVLGERVDPPFVPQGTGDGRIDSVNTQFNILNTFTRTEMVYYGFALASGVLVLSLFTAYLVQRCTSQDRVLGDDKNKERSDLEVEYMRKMAAVVNAGQKITKELITEIKLLKSEKRELEAKNKFGKGKMEQGKKRLERSSSEEDIKLAKRISVFTPPQGAVVRQLESGRQHNKTEAEFEKMTQKMEELEGQLRKLQEREQVPMEPWISQTSSAAWQSQAGMYPYPSTTSTGYSTGSLPPLLWSSSSMWNGASNGASSSSSTSSSSYVNSSTYGKKS